MKKHFKIIFSLIVLTIVAGLMVHGNPEVGIIGASVYAFAPLVGFAPLKWPAGSENMGGYKNFILFIPADHVSAIPELPTEITDAKDLVTATGSFVFKEEGGLPTYIYATDKSVDYNADNQGETDGQSFLQKGEFSHPGTQVDAAAFSRKVNNTSGYIIYEDTNGVQYMVGSKGHPATIKPSYVGGKQRTDKKGFIFTFEADSFAPLIVLGTPIDIDAIENPVVIP